MSTKCVFNKPISTVIKLTTNFINTIVDLRSFRTEIPNNNIKHQNKINIHFYLVKKTEVAGFGH